MQKTIDWGSIFRYDPETGHLFWAIRKKGVRNQHLPCGTKTDRGYLSVMVNKVNHRVHRIAWEMVNGPIPDGMEIDHENHVRDDNRLVNLRLTDGNDNHKNMSLYKTNTSGCPGVRWCKSRKKWVATLTHNKKVISLGRYDNLNDAIHARKEAEKKYGTFHKNHGR